ncbi:hypothetical protein Tco_0707332 [Tanacetum coccineum]|uniref:Prolactin receptor n=1 Tax=Tanacetum coccineum TaxID=301880 RepID=A0ABQ4YBH8_9ASTR
MPGGQGKRLELCEVNPLKPSLHEPPREDDWKSLWTTSRSLGYSSQICPLTVLDHTASKGVKTLNLSLNWEKEEPFYGQRGICPRPSKISKNRIEVDKAKTMRSCVHGKEALDHSRSLNMDPTGGHHWCKPHSQKIFELRLLCPPSIKMPTSLSRTVTRANVHGKFTTDEMPQNSSSLCNL